MTDKQRQVIDMVREHGFGAGPAARGDVLVWLSHRPIMWMEVARAVPLKHEYIRQDGPAVRIMVSEMI